MYDPESLGDLLVRLGYENVREVPFREGKISAVAQLDLPERKSESFYIEAE